MTVQKKSVTCVQSASALCSFLLAYRWEKEEKQKNCNWDDRKNNHYPQLMTPLYSSGEIICVIGGRKFSLHP